MIKRKFKPILPSLREKKRYLVFEVISSHKFDFRSIQSAIVNAILGFLGQLGFSRAGIIVMEDRWDEKSQRGIIKVNHKNVDNLKASLVFVNNINNGNAVVRSMGLSGILNKAVKKMEGY